MHHIFRVGLLILAVFLTTTLKSHAIEPFDSMKDSAKDVISKAESAGDNLIKSLGEQMLATIEAMESAAVQVINEGKDAALIIEGELFKDISETLGRLEAGERLVMADMTKLTAEWTSMAGRLPFVSNRPEVMVYRPRVLAAVGPDQVILTVVGPNLGDSEATASYGGKELTVLVHSGTELGIVIPRDYFTYAEDAEAFESITLSYDAAPAATWWKPGTWFDSDLVERNLTLKLLPKTLAQYAIDPTVNTSKTETKTFKSTTNARGKDSQVGRTVVLPDPLIDDGWRFNTKAILKGKYEHKRTKDQGGSSCIGVIPKAIKSTKVGFNHQIGHKNEPFGRSSDGWVNCNVTLPLVRTVKGTKLEKTIVGKLVPGKDTLEKLPPATRSYDVRVQIYNGRELVIQDGIPVPYGLVEVQRAADSVHFRPLIPSDF